MKTIIFTFAGLLFLFAANCYACPIYLKGKIIVVDELNKPIKNAALWQYFSLKDSFKLKAGDRFRVSDETEKEANIFFIYTQGLRFYPKDYKPANKEFRIKAEGFADVIIDAVNFKYAGWNDSVPVLLVTLYAQKFIKSGTSIFLVDEFRAIEKIEIEKKDTIHLKLTDYIGPQQSENHALMNGSIGIRAQIYPNPASEYLTIKISKEIKEPYIAFITDQKGILLKEILLENQETKINLEWQKPGNYLLLIRDEKGQPVHSQVIIKL